MEGFGEFFMTSYMTCLKALVSLHFTSLNLLPDLPHPSLWLLGLLTLRTLTSEMDPPAVHLYLSLWVYAFGD